MVSKIRTVAFLGLRPIEIMVEAQSSPGMSSFSIVGLPDKAVGEAKERIRAAFFQLGIGMPVKKIVINMAPADLPKAGSHYDLPIALAIMGAIEVIDISVLENFIVIGELGLDGSLPYISGTLCASMLANENNFSILCPKTCEKEAIWSGNNSIIAAPNLGSILNHISGRTQIASSEFESHNFSKSKEFGIDMSDVYGQNLAKRALEVAVSGAHNVLMIGAPGSGKSMLAERLQTILPNLEAREALETTCVYSISGKVPDDGLIYSPPYRAPHNSASLMSIVGGGTDAKPGEISLAHNGILFLDELPEFQKATIDSLRQPLETNDITISRAKEHITYPANIQLVAAMNPCKCGYFGNTHKQCSKAPKCAVDYRNRISGPILDRFDIIVYVNDIKISEFFKNTKGETSKIIRERVRIVRDIQKSRVEEEGKQGSYLNAKMHSNKLEKILFMDEETKIFFQTAIERLDLSARGYHKILRVARTIADMERSKSVKREHIAEAMQYRLLKIID
ncbi:MAG: YifB family Mg chelatase-like AAA ATPase [Holosporales bacterium]|jgi:magnesium chelatase family protein|nr:YifB family Mg chelatase-like AAA ATPase [Holosporales bacterium]